MKRGRYCILQSSVQSWQFFHYHVPRVHVRGGNEICSCQIWDWGQRGYIREATLNIYPRLKLCRGRPLAAVLMNKCNAQSRTQSQSHICFATFMEVIWAHDNNIQYPPNACSRSIICWPVFSWSNVRNQKIFFISYYIRPVRLTWKPWPLIIWKPKERGVRGF